jgi:hypothetical protein
MPICWSASDRRGDLPEERCWLRGPDWVLAYG